MRRWPAGAALSTSDIAREAELDKGTMSMRLTQLARYGVVACHSRSARPMLWTLGPAADLDAAIVEMRKVWHMSRATHDNRASAMDRAKLAAQTQAVGKLRDLMFDGSAAASGDPLRLLADALEVARLVRTAKLRPGCRFTGAEVEIMVASELRQISEAARLATGNLREWLGVMLA
jgi:hypothetical protein